MPDITFNPTGTVPETDPATLDVPNGTRSITICNQTGVCVTLQGAPGVFPPNDPIAFQVDETKSVQLGNAGGSYSYDVPSNESGNSPRAPRTGTINIRP